MACCAPSPTASMAITAPTPTIMPSMVRTERSLFLARARIAMRRRALKSMIGSVLECRKGLENVGRARPISHLFIAADLSITELNRALRELSNIGFMGYQDDGQALIVEFLKNPHDFNRRATVEIPRGLVGQKDRGPVHEGARNGNALLLAARKLGREVLDAVSESHQVQGFTRPLFSFLFADLRIQRG